MKYSKYNVVIIGSGISGLFLANKLAIHNNFQDGILLITKGKLFSGSSALAQGGIVSVIPEFNPEDSIQSHIKDTITAGCGLNKLDIVKYVSQNSSTVTQELISLGVDFDKNSKNKLNFTLEAAHSHPRILHAKGDSTGKIIESVLCKRLEDKTNIELYQNTMAIELLVDKKNICKGVIVYNWENKTYEAIYSSNIILATGGIGQIFKTTTNPLESTGDGIALAYSAGGEIENMEFIQFHPTALYCKDKISMPLISESARGEGAKLVDLNGDYFAKKYHPLADLAPRDIVARAIMNHIKENNFDYVNLDISQIGIEKFKQRFPTITSLCIENNIDINSGLIPVIPAEHYLMGGIKVDINSKTNIENLYAIGECASTGLHGANRLASNSLLECVVFANKLADDLVHDFKEPPKKNDEKIKELIDKYQEIDDGCSNDEFLLNQFKKLKEIMSENAGISRCEKGLNNALDTVFSLELEIKNYQNSKIKYELKNALTIAKLILQSALKRKNSIGAHYRKDYPILETELINKENNYGKIPDEQLCN